MAQQTRYIDFMLVQCWATVFDAVPTLNRNRINVSCLLGEGGGVEGCSIKKSKQFSIAIFQAMMAKMAIFLAD